MRLLSQDLSNWINLPYHQWGGFIYFYSYATLGSIVKIFDEWTPSDISGRNDNNPIQTLSENTGGGNISQIILWGLYALLPKLDKDISGKEDYRWTSLMNAAKLSANQAQDVI